MGTKKSGFFKRIDFLKIFSRPKPAIPANPKQRRNIVEDQEQVPVIVDNMRVDRTNHFR